LYAKILERFLFIFVLPYTGLEALLKRAPAHMYTVYTGDLSQTQYSLRTRSLIKVLRDCLTILADATRAISRIIIVLV